MDVRRKPKAKAPKGWRRPPRPSKPLTFAESVWVFALGSLIGYLLETAYILFNDRKFESRQGMVYGPFNQVYGLGAIAIVAAVQPVLKKGKFSQFLAGAVVGGVFEAACAVVEENLFKTRSWDYSHTPVSMFGGRSNSLYMLFWGFLTLGYMEWIHPGLLGIVHRMPTPVMKASAGSLVNFFSINLIISALAVARWSERVRGIAAEGLMDAILDVRFPDERMTWIYPNMKHLSRSSG